VSESEEEYQAQVRRDLPRNYTAHIAHGMLGQTGFRLIQAPTFIEAFVVSMGGTPLALGAIRACQSFGMFLSPIFGATSIEHRPRVLPAGMLIGGLMRVQVLGIALAAFFLTGETALYTVGTLLALFGFFMGMQGVVFSFLTSKVIPVELRGRLMGLRQLLGGITAATVGRIGGELVENGAFGNGFATTFGLAFILTSLGLLTLLFMKEPIPPGRREPSRMGQRLRELPELLRSDADFTRYFLARALAVMGRMSLPFYVPFADERLHIGGSELGELTFAYVLSMSASNLVWGLIADRTGYRLTFIAALSMWVGSVLLLMNADSFSLMLAVMAGLGAGQGGFMMSSQNLVLEFGSRQNLPMRIAVANSASEVVGVIAPLLGGVLITVYGFTEVFWTGIAFQLAAIAWVWLAVRDPRHRTGPAGT
jgi:MFS family permease